MLTGSLNTARADESGKLSYIRGNGLNGMGWGIRLMGRVRATARRIADAQVFCKDSPR